MTHLLSCFGLGIATLAIPALVFNDTLSRHAPISISLGLLVVSAVIATATIYLGRECLQLLQQDQL